ncbi:MAG: Uma2 family endonuclease [Gammaproteobacteria bacterium]
MNTVQEIKNALSGLTRMEREIVSIWIRELGTERVEEPAATYSTPARYPHLSVEDYLKLEEDGDIRHEYVDGAVYAMSGVSEAHIAITGDIFAALWTHLRGTPCTPYFVDFKVRLEVNHKDLFYYPDVMVACGREGVEKHYLRYPKLVVEVLSPSTEKTDRREKLLSYTQIETLMEYVLVSQDAREVTLHRRGDAWRPQVVKGRSAIDLMSVNLSLPLDRVYERLPL